MSFFKISIFTVLTFFPFFSYGIPGGEDIQDAPDVMCIHRYLQGNEELNSSLRDAGKPDVHAFTPLAKEHGPGIIVFGENLKAQLSVEAPTLEEVFNNITDSFSSADSGVNMDHIGQVRQTISTNPAIDPETGLDVHNMLSSAWALAGDAHEKTMIAVALAANIDDNGGCYGGIANRLLESYARILESFQ